MTNSDDRIGPVIEAFLDYLDGEGDEPSLDDLDAEERAQAEDLIANLKAGRGINPYASRPSLEHLLAGTPLEDVLHAEPVPADRSPAELLDEIRTQLALYSPLHADVWKDEAADASAVRSTFVVLIGSQRFRIQVRSDIPNAAALARLDPAEAAGPVYGRFPDTAGVIVLYPDDDLSSLAIDPFDPEYCIETPAGTVERPSVHRPVMPLADTVRSYLDEIAPTLDATVDADVVFDSDVDTTELARAVAMQAIESVVNDGRRARIDAKQNAWSALGEHEVDEITNVVLDALAGGLSETDIVERITALCDAA